MNVSDDRRHAHCPHMSRRAHANPCPLVASTKPHRTKSRHQFVFKLAFVAHHDGALHGRVLLWHHAEQDSIRVSVHHALAHVHSLIDVQPSLFKASQTD